jgi:ribosomal protein L40E
MHKNNFVVALKCNRQILRERENGVYLPFNSEFSILLKNLETRKASVKIFIDGQNIFGNNSTYILDGGHEREIERFAENLSSGNRFKFIRKTSEIAEYRGDKIDDGLIRVEFTFEKQRNCIEYYTICNTYYYPSYYPPYYPPYPKPKRVAPSRYTWTDETVSLSSSSGIGSAYNINSTQVRDIQASNFQSSNGVVPNVDEGITTKGSISNQKFIEACIGELEEVSHTITLQLRGFIGTMEEVEKPITTGNKLICTMCGLASNSDATYCKRCGTYLI